MLSGEKVVLRPLTKDDYPYVLTATNDVALNALADDDYPRPKTLEELQEEFDEMRKKGELAAFIIEVDGRRVGDCGLHHIDTHSRSTSFGLSIFDPSDRGKGYGRDAVRVLVDYAFRLRNLRRVWLTVFADNEAAVNTYRKLGFVEEGRLRQHVWNDGAYRDWLYMGLLDEEWSG